MGSGVNRRPLHVYLYRPQQHPFNSGALSNDGSEPLYVPGFNRLLLDDEVPAEERFAHGFADWAQARLTAREVAMLRLMNDLTDRPGWSRAVLHDDIALLASWREEARSTRSLISDAAWDWCLDELRDAANDFRKTNCLDVLNSASGVCKADGRVSLNALNILRAGVQSLIVEKSPSGLPETHLDLIDPTSSLLAFGATPAVLADGGYVPLDNIFSSLSVHACTTPAPHQQFRNRPNTPPPRYEVTGLPDWWSQDDAVRYFWSPEFQLLPCDVHFSNNGNGATISSYINDLHPGRYSGVYKAIEDVIAAAIPMWNRVLVKLDADQLPPRIRTYGPVIEPPGPLPWFERVASLDRYPNKVDRLNPEYQEALALVSEYFSLPEPPEHERLPPNLGEYNDMSSWNVETCGFSATLYRKLARLRHVIHPEPGQRYSYTAWKAGHANLPIVPGIYRPDHHHPHQREPVKLTPLNPPTLWTQHVLSHPDHIFPPSLDLAQTFSTTGLQIITSLHRTVLSPTTTSHLPPSKWHVDGMLNEHVVASALLLISHENVTPPSIDFCVEADLDPYECGYPEDEAQFRAMELTFDFADSPGALANDTPALQKLGSVKLVVNGESGGRMVAYPHGMQHRMGAVELLDKTKEGWYDVMELWLVDPNYRICSTRNVPPQRHDWWIEEVMGLESKGEKKKGGWRWPRSLPNEIVHQIREETADFPVSMEQLREWQRKRREHEEICQDAVQYCVAKYFFLEDRPDGSLDDDIEFED